MTGNVRYHETQLMEVMGLYHEVMSDLHRNTVNGLVNKCRQNKQHLSRTDHKQLASIFKRYDDAIRIAAIDEQVGTDTKTGYTRVRMALKQAGQLDKIADKMAETFQKTLRRGNVQYVDKV